MMTATPPQNTGRSRMSADVDAPDKVLYGLTFRQLAILAVAAVILVTAWHSLHRLLPTPVLTVAGIAAAALTFGVAVGRRDGLPLDVWLLHAVRFSHGSRARTTTGATAHVPDWVTPPRERVQLPAPLRLPAEAIADNGEISLRGQDTAIVATTTVNLTLRTADEQDALISAFGSWLNSLTEATQIVVSAQPVDLQSQADTLAARAGHLAHPALAAACTDHAAFLADLARHRDPLRRQVLIAGRVPASPDTPHAAKRRADDTARILSGLGVGARTLDGPAATVALAGCADPYRPPRTAGLAPPDAVITATPRKKA
jgi:hypothetical protein